MTYLTYYMCAEFSFKTTELPRIYQLELEIETSFNCTPSSLQAHRGTPFIRNSVKQRILTKKTFDIQKFFAHESWLIICTK